MEDQLNALERLGVIAAKLNANSSKEEVNFVQTVGFKHYMLLLSLNILTFSSQ